MEMAMKTVRYDPPNAMKCQCTRCPVQGQSACASGKMQAMSGMMDQMRGMMESGSQSMGASGEMSGQPEAMMPPPQDMPGLYCSTGTAACGDLDYAKACVCPTCQVWTDNQLESQQYCRQGSAAQVG